MKKVITIVLIGMLANLSFSAELSQDQMMIAFKNSEKNLAKLLKTKPMQWPAGKKQPATRAEVAQEFNRIFEHYKPQFKITPRPYEVNMKAIQTNEDKVTRRNLAKLVEWGCVGPVSRLVVGPNEGMTNKQFGDALGYLYSQILRLTKQPHPKWTPELMGIDG